MQLEEHSLGFFPQGYLLVYMSHSFQLAACSCTVTTRGVPHPLPSIPDLQTPTAPPMLTQPMAQGSLLPFQRARGERGMEGYRKILFNWSSTSLPGKRGLPALASSGRKRTG